MDKSRNDCIGCNLPCYAVSIELATLLPIGLSVLLNVAYIEVSINLRSNVKELTVLNRNTEPAVAELEGGSFVAELHTRTP